MPYGFQRESERFCRFLKRAYFKAYRSSLASGFAESSSKQKRAAGVNGRGVSALVKTGGIATTFNGLVLF